MRGPALAPGGLGGRVPAHRTNRERFDQIAVEVMREVEAHWAELAGVELAVEEIPTVPATWASTRIPLASFSTGTATTAPRLVLFRRPIELRAAGRADLEAMVLTVVVEQLADWLGVPPEQVHPGYEPD